MVEKSQVNLARRRVVAGLATLPCLGWPAAAAAPEAVSDILARSGLATGCGFAVADAATGEILEAHAPETERPPASAVKLLTALWALDAPGPAYRFATRLEAGGPVADGVLDGDLVLVGTGDPMLDTDALGDMAAALAAHGVRAITGRLLVVAGALPALADIDGGQPVHAGYNPAISGMNLNFNRVHLGWTAADGGPRLRLTAPGLRFDTGVATVRAELATDGSGWQRADAAGRETWRMRPADLRGSGSVWLPVRQPARYAGEVFGSLAGAAGVALPEAQVVNTARPGTVLVARDSPEMARIIPDMLRYSTNLTAEVVGLRASQARGGAPADLAASAGAMADWARDRYGLRGGRLVNHSGLSDRSVLSASDMLRVLTGAPELAALLRARQILDADGRPLHLDGVQVLAKTGTLYFASALAGYLHGPRRRLAFASLTSDPAARAAMPRGTERPPGARAWSGRARGQEQALLRRWAAVYA